jgi:capsular exopolysaccharide synthesis family protein
MMSEGNELMLRPDRYGAPLAPYSPQHRPVQLPPEPAEQGILTTIVRHAWIVILVMVVCMGGALVYLQTATKYYTSTCQVYLEQTPGVRIMTDQLDPTPGGNYLFTQCDVLMSTALLNSLLQRPEIQQIASVPKDSTALPWLRKSVNAEVDHKTDEIDVEVTTVSPDDSATLSNLLVDTYTMYMGKKAGFPTAAVMGQVGPEYDKLQAEFKQDQQDLDEWRSVHPDLAMDIGSAASVQSQKLASAIQNYSQVHGNLIDAQQSYGPGYPQVIKLERLSAVAYNEYLDALHEMEKANGSAKEFIRLQAELARIRPMLDQYEARILELQMRGKLSQELNNITIIEPGSPPRTPSSPKPLETLAITFAFALVLGTGLALLRERMDGRIRSPDEIQTLVGLPVLGVVPHMSGRRTAVARAMAVHLDPRSSVAEAYRSIRTAIYFGGGSVHARTVLITSPEPGDGKTTNASNLAIAIAQTGRSVLLLDADFRKPTQHKNLDVKDAVGLSSVLAGIAPLDQAVQHTGVEGLDILPCGAIPENPSEILNSQEFGDLVDRLALKYDYILFDSPPVNLVADARILGAVCDGTILVLRSGQSTRRGAEHARNALLGVGTNILGVIVNDTSRGKGYETYGGAYYSLSTIPKSPRPGSPDAYADGRSPADISGMDAHPTNGSSGSGLEDHGEADNDAPRVATGGVANGASKTRRVARAGDQVTG